MGGMMRTGVAVLFCASAAANAGVLDGQWNGSLNGQPVTLVLNKDGSGSLDGESLKYEAAGGVLILHLRRACGPGRRQPCPANWCCSAASLPVAPGLRLAAHCRRR